MPYLQLDTTGHYSSDKKRALAKRFGEIHAEVMQATPDIVNVAVRELGEGGLWNCSVGDPHPSSVLTLAIRRGRPPEQRERMAVAILAACTEILGLDPERVTVEFQEHAGNDIYMQRRDSDGVLRGGLGRDWSPDEVNHSVIETVMAEQREKPGGSSALSKSSSSPTA
jgi:phenylpyruvate tautomerase PptA (4-oxalocrotonate tautomerase family)